MSGGGEALETSSAFDGLVRLWRDLVARKVAQWGAAYVVAAFGLLQGVSFVRTTFELPLAIDRVAFVILAMGLPIALILAWHHGDLGRRRVTRLEGGLLAACGVIGVSLALMAAAPTVPEQRIARGEVPRLAVLRFESLGATEPYFAETVADELISFASKVKGLEVIARPSSFALTGERATPAAAARELGATLVLTGSVRREGERVRVIAQLSEAPGGKQLWTREFERPIGEIYLLQREIAAKVALAAGLTARAPSASRVDPAAYALYMRGREVDQGYETIAAVRAAELYEQAVAIDANFASAWAALANARSAAAIRAWLTAPPGTALSAEAMEPAFRAAEQAIALDPSSPSAYETQSRALGMLGRWREALKAAEAAAIRGGGAPISHAQLGYTRQALANARRLVDRDPLWVAAWHAVSQHCSTAGDTACYLEAEETADRLEATVPPMELALALHRAGRSEEALRLTQSEEKWRLAIERDPSLNMAVIRAMLGEGEPPPVSVFIRSLDSGEAYPDSVIWILAELGEVEAIAPLLTRWTAAERVRLPILYDSRLGKMRERPEFWALMEREGILQVWRETGQWPDFCQREPVCRRYGQPAA